MTTAIPQPSPPPPAAAPTASSSGASPVPDAAAVQVQGALAANTVRFQFLMDRLDAFFKGKILFQNSDFANLIFSFAKAIDYSLASNDLPAVALHLPSVIKQVYQRRHEGGLHTAIMVLMISVKNACKSGWFNPIAAEELLSMTNEFCNSFCIALSSASAVGRATEIVSHILQRFYPQLKLCHLIVSFEVKPGYEILVADFLIPRNISPQERIRLFVVHTDSLETSACIISPPQVSFLVNGKGVERRTNISLDNGPQFPTDITKMLKYGMNMMQAIGYFSGSYIIAIAFTRSIEIATPTLSDYIQPVIESPNSDSELIVGASRISINCPISFRRIKTPVKGHLCKHQQCFDYDNFIEMNSRKPSWRCPCCNQPVSYIDLRIDRNMDKILGEVADDITDVVISADGSWKAIASGNGDTDGQHNGPTEGKKDNNLEHGSDSTNMVTEVMDLTMEEDGELNAALGARQGCVSSTTSHCNAPAYESEDRKPFKNSQGFPNSEFYMESAVLNSTSSNTQLTAHTRGYGIWSTMSSSASSTNGSLSISTAPNAHAIGTLESLVPNVVLNPVMTDAISPAVNQESGTAPQASHATLHLQQASQVNQLPENMHLLQARYGNSIVSNGTERSPIPRHVSRTPIAVQALPVQTQMPPLRMRTNVINSSAVTSSSSSLSYQLVPLEQATSLQHSRPQLFSAQNHQNQLHNQQSRNPIAAPNLIGTRTSTSVQGAYRLASQTPVNGQTPHHQPSNTRVRHTASQVTAAHSQSSHISSMQAQQAPQSNASLSVGSLMSSQSQLLAARRAAQAARLQTGVTSSPAWKTALSTPLPADGLRLSGSNLLQNMPLGTTLPQTHRTASSTPLPTDGPRVDQLQSLATGATTATRTDVVSVLPSELHWRPTGRMRGSLTGTAYAVALSHYVSAPNQPVVAQPMAPVVAPISDQMATLNSMDTHGPQTQQAYTNNAEIGSQPRHPSTL